ncbi:hypothetical protein D3C72_1535690 [compost metagenome]
MLVDAGSLLLGRALGAGRGAFLRAFGEGFVQRRFGLLERNAGAATVYFLAGEAFGGDFDVRCQQHHIGFGDRLCAQRIACADRALSFHLQVIAQTLGCLLQRFGGHEGVSDAGWTRGDRHQTRGAFGDGNRFGDSFRREINLSLFGTTAQHCFDILQGLGRGALVDALADKSGHVHRRARHQQHPLGR